MTQLLLELAGLTAAALAGTGGCLLGIRAADHINHWLGRDATEEPQETK